MVKQLMNEPSGLFKDLGKDVKSRLEKQHD
jgi:hypothetical protein